MQKSKKTSISCFNLYYFLYNTVFNKNILVGKNSIEKRQLLVFLLFISSNLTLSQMAKLTIEDYDKLKLGQSIVLKPDKWCPLRFTKRGYLNRYSLALFIPELSDSITNNRKKNEALFTINNHYNNIFLLEEGNYFNFINNSGINLLFILSCNIYFSLMKKQLLKESLKADFSEGAVSILLTKSLNKRLYEEP
uniref:hypothetical protein n=1 Tax=Ulva meridionalis TaxID=434723 RepID=UPI0028E09FDA|nr:hypothetical protein NQY40_pgp080 [Ulva meridionalis]WFS80031.1 hypothetical protein [Ulva meridionalis]